MVMPLSIFICATMVLKNKVAWRIVILVFKLIISAYLEGFKYLICSVGSEPKKSSLSPAYSENYFAFLNLFFNSGLPSEISF